MTTRPSSRSLARLRDPRGATIVELMIALLVLASACSRWPAVPDRLTQPAPDRMTSTASYYAQEKVEELVGALLGGRGTHRRPPSGGTGAKNSAQRGHGAVLRGRGDGAPLDNLRR